MARTLALVLIALGLSSTQVTALSEDTLVSLRVGEEYVMKNVIVCRTHDLAYMAELERTAYYIANSFIQSETRGWYAYHLAHGVGCARDKDRAGDYVKFTDRSCRFKRMTRCIWSGEKEKRIVNPMHSITYQPGATHVISDLSKDAQVAFVILLPGTPVPESFGSSIADVLAQAESFQIGAVPVPRLETKKGE